MSLTLATIKETVQAELGDMVEKITVQEWEIQESGFGWDVIVVVDEEKYAQKFGTASHEIFEQGLALDNIIEERFPEDEKSSYYTFNIHLDKAKV